MFKYTGHNSGWGILIVAVVVVVLLAFALLSTIAFYIGSLLHSLWATVLLGMLLPGLAAYWWYQPRYFVLRCAWLGGSFGFLAYTIRSATGGTVIASSIIMVVTVFFLSASLVIAPRRRKKLNEGPWRKPRTS